jgi:hypothetical protein
VRCSFNVLGFSAAYHLRRRLARRQGRSQRAVLRSCAGLLYSACSIGAGRGTSSAGAAARARRSRARACRQRSQIARPGARGRSPHDELGGAAIGGGRVSPGRRELGEADGELGLDQPLQLAVERRLDQLLHLAVALLEHGVHDAGDALLERRGHNGESTTPPAVLP